MSTSMDSMAKKPTCWALLAVVTACSSVKSCEHQLKTAKLGSQHTAPHRGGRLVSIYHEEDTCIVTPLRTATR